MYVCDGYQAFLLWKFLVIGPGQKSLQWAKVKTKCHFPWQLLTENRLKSLHFERRAFCDLYFLIAPGLDVGESFS